MEVSHFELIYKRQSPVGVGGTGPIDTALQGYFLEISNLEAFELRFEVEFVAQLPAPGQTLRSLAGNTLVFIDTPGVNNAPTVLAGGIGSTSFFPASGLITVAPHATALIGVVPSVFGATPFDPTPIDPATKEFEVRGYVKLNLPALRVNAFFSRAQANSAVKVMLTPQNRTTYFREGGGLSDQTQASLPTANGAAVAFVQPEPSKFTFPDIFLSEIEIARLPTIAEAARPAALAGLLADLDDDPASLGALNRALGEIGVPVVVERRTVKPARRGVGGQVSESV